MSSSAMPTYRFRPRASASRPTIRTCSTRRARLWAGGTYFRSREPGLQANLLSVEVIEVVPPGLGVGEGYCVITNHVPTSECVTGDLSTSLLELQGTYADLWRFDRLNDTPRARTYSISVRIAFERQTDSSILPPTFESEESAPYGRLFTSGKISVKPLPGPLQATSESVAFIAPRTRLYALSVVPVPPPPDSVGGVTTYGFSIADLRAQVNAHDPWVEMIPRTPIPESSGGPPVQVVLNDAFDSRQDALALTPFARTNLGGGDGLPASPNADPAGPTRALVHVNYGEAHDGTLREVNLMYEWIGDSAIAGSWSVY